MTTQRLIAEIEDGDLRFDLGLASTTDALLRRMGRNPFIAQASQRLKTNPAEYRPVLGRAEALFSSCAPEGYANPSDLPLSAYLFILGQLPIEAVQTFLERVASNRLPEFYAAPRVARYFTERIPATTVH